MAAQDCHIPVAQTPAVLRTIRALVLLCWVWSAGRVLAADVILPFELTDGHIHIVLTDKNGTARDFIFDTGATSILLDQQVASASGIVPTKTTEVTSLNTTTELGSVERQQLGLSEDVQLRRLKFILYDLSDFGADGIIGYDILKAYVTKIDYVNRQLLLYRKAKGIDLSGYSALRIGRSKIPTIDVSLTTRNGDRFTGKVFVDSGAALPVLVGSTFASETGLAKLIGKQLTTTSQGLSALSVSHVAAVEKIEVSGYTLGPMPVRLATQSMGVFADNSEFLGILGNQILSRFDIVLDYRKKRMYLKPNTSYDEPFDFPMSGITLEEKDGRVRVRRMIEESAAFRDGLRAGDWIESIDGDTSGDIRSYEAQLKVAGADIELTYSRPGETGARTIKFLLRRLL